MIFWSYFDYVGKNGMMNVYREFKFKILYWKNKQEIFKFYDILLEVLGYWYWSSNLFESF